MQQTPEPRPEYANTPLVTIGIPTYNGARRIARSLTSVWKQDYPNLEIIIADNCSTDNTKEVVETLAQGHPAIKYIRHEKNIGMMPNFNFLLKQGTGKYFMWLSDDDQIEPGTIPKYVQFMEEHGDYSLVSGIVKHWKEETLDVVESGFTFEQKSPAVRVLDFYGKVVYCGILHGLMRRDLAKNVPIHNIIGNDYHLVANLAYLGKVKNFDFTGYNKHLGGTSKSFRQYAKAMGESDLTGRFPHFKMASDAYREINDRSPVYAHLPFLSKKLLGAGAFVGVLFSYYVRIQIVERFRKRIVRPLQKVFGKQNQKIQ